MINPTSRSQAQTSMGAVRQRRRSLVRERGKDLDLWIEGGKGRRQGRQHQACQVHPVVVHQDHHQADPGKRIDFTQFS